MQVIIAGHRCGEDFAGTSLQACVAGHRCGEDFAGHHRRSSLRGRLGRHALRGRLGRHALWQCVDRDVWAGMRLRGCVAGVRCGALGWRLGGRRAHARERPLLSLDQLQGMLGTGGGGRGLRHAGLGLLFRSSFLRVHCPTSFPQKENAWFTLIIYVILTGTLPAAILYILRVLPPLVCAQTPGHVRATAPMPDLPCVYTHAVFLDVFGPWPHRLSCNGQG